MAFIITKKVLENKSYDLKDPDAVVGPRNIRPETEARLRNGEGEKFRMLDDDDILYFEGLFIDDGEAEDWEVEAEFQPLDAYGRPDSGAVQIQYKNKDGVWESI